MVPHYFLQQPLRRPQHGGNCIDQVQGLRNAIHTLYGTADGGQRRSADRWLSRFQIAPGSWSVCLQLLSLPHTLDQEKYFAANTLKTICQKYQDILQQHVAPQLPAQLSILIHSLLQQNLLIPAAQLSAALGALLVRSHLWHPTSILPTVRSLVVRANIDPASGVQLLDPSSLATLLHCWAAVGESAASKQVAVSAERREAVTAALQQSQWVVPMVGTALQSQSTMLVQLGCQLVCRWCELGRAPAGLETRPDAIEVIAGAVLQPQLNEAAAECLVLLFQSCKDQSHVPSGSQLLQLLLQQLQMRLLPTLAAQQTAMGLPSPCAVVGQQMGEKAEVSFCRILAAAAGALLKPAWQQGGQSLLLMQALQDQLLVHVTDALDGMALAALEFWQSSYLEPLVALPEEVQAGLVAQQQQVLLSLAAAVIKRTQLTPAAADAATADARDLPDEIRTVRREMASALRDITHLLGMQAMLAAITQVVQQYWQYLAPSVVHGPGGFGGLGVSGMLPPSSGAASSSSSTLSLGGNSSKHHWLALESAMYAANVVLGKGGGDFPPGVHEQLCQLTQLAAAAVTHPCGSMKLAGTCLTLLGGLAPWYVQHPQKLPPLLACMNAALKSADEKLARNAATCVQRLSTSTELCALLVQQQPAFVSGLVQEYHTRGGLQMRAGQGDDMTTEELLLLSLCNLAVASAEVGGPNSPKQDQLDQLLLQLAAPQLTSALAEVQEVAWLLSNTAAAASAATAAPAADSMAAAPLLLQPAQQQTVVAASHTAIRCFRSLTTLVSGLPARLPKGATILASKPPIKLPPSNPVADAAAQPGAAQQQQQQGQGQQWAQGLNPNLQLPPGSMAEQVLGGGGLAGTSQAPAGASSHQPIGNGAADAAATAAAATAAAAAAAAAAPLGPRELRARWLISQMVAYSWPLVQLCRQLLVSFYAAPALPQPLCTCAEHLLIAVCDYLSQAVPGAARSKGNPATTPGLAAGADSAMSAASQVQAVQRLVVQVMQEVQQLPDAAIQRPCCLQLLGVVLCTLGSEDLGSGAADGRSILSGQQLLVTGALSAIVAEPISQQQQEQDQLLSLQMLQLLQEQMQKALNSTCGLLLSQQQGCADPHHVSMLLLLLTAAIQSTPCVLTQVMSGPTSEQALTLLQVAASTYHLEQCNAVLSCVQALVQGPYARAQVPERLQLLLMDTPWVPMASAAAAVGDAAGALSLHATGLPLAAAIAPAVTAVGQHRQQVLADLRLRLESGWAARLVLALLMAASGQMPPDMVVQVSGCLHGMWQLVGDSMFSTWLELAVVHLAPESACWQGLRHQQKLAFMQQLLEPACVHDLARFKKVLKAFCTGKRKGR